METIIRRKEGRNYAAMPKHKGQPHDISAPAEGKVLEAETSL